MEDTRGTKIENILYVHGKGTYNREKEGGKRQVDTWIIRSILAWVSGKATGGNKGASNRACG
jgi:hypothetical protein